MLSLMSLRPKSLSPIEAFLILFKGGYYVVSSLRPKSLSPIEAAAASRYSCLSFVGEPQAQKPEPN